MNAATQYRRQKELEEKKLQARLQLLRAELKKTQMALAATEARAAQIATRRKELEERERLRKQLEEEREKMRQAIQQSNRLAEERLRAIRLAHVQDIRSRNKELVQQVQEERKRHKELIEEQRKRELEKVAQLKAIVKQHENLGKQARVQLLNERRQDARQDLLARVKQETARTEEMQQRINEMEKEEKRLIEELERVHKAHVEATERLIALTRSPRPRRMSSQLQPLSSRLQQQPQEQTLSPRSVSSAAASS